LLILDIRNIRRQAAEHLLWRAHASHPSLSFSVHFDIPLWTYLNFVKAIFYTHKKPCRNIDLEDTTRSRLVTHSKMTGIKPSTNSNGMAILLSTWYGTESRIIISNPPIFLSLTYCKSRTVGFNKNNDSNSDKSREISNFKYLENHSSEELSANYNVQLLDSFFRGGPNGVHQCLVFELLGPSVEHVINDYVDGPDDLEPEINLRMSRQLLKL